MISVTDVEKTSYFRSGAVVSGAFNAVPTGGTDGLGYEDRQYADTECELGAGCSEPEDGN